VGGGSPHHLRVCRRQCQVVTHSSPRRRCAKKQMLECGVALVGCYSTRCFRNPINLMKWALFSNHKPYFVPKKLKNLNSYGRVSEPLGRIALGDSRSWHMMECRSVMWRCCVVRVPDPGVWPATSAAQSWVVLRERERGELASPTFLGGNTPAT